MQNLVLGVVLQILSVNPFPVATNFNLPEINFTELQDTNPNYREFKKQNYKILEVGKIVLYQQNKYKPKSMYAEPSYFFSLTIESEILPLTLFNLQQVFKNNVKIYQILELRFAGREADLILYDTIHKTYKVNYWLSL